MASNGQPKCRQFIDVIEWSGIRKLFIRFRRTVNPTPAVAAHHARAKHGRQMQFENRLARVKFAGEDGLDVRVFPHY
jgi:hypothetical protein